MIDEVLEGETVSNRLPIGVEEILTFSNQTLKSWGLSGDTLIYVRTFSLLIICTVVGFCLWWLTRKIFLEIIHAFAVKTKTKWDDYLVKNNFFSALAHLVLILFMDYFLRIVLNGFPRIKDFGVRLTDFVTIFVLIIVFTRFLNTARDVLSEKPRLKDKPIHSFFQLAKIIIGLVFGILMISVAFNVDLIVILTSMGAMTAVLLLVFKDTILGFVGSIQLAANDMVRIGDWVTMDKFGADGDVQEITLTTVKVQNFDKTITTIPTYSFISDSFKNWRGMEESGGRRITRSINIQISSIKFCTPEMLKKFREIELIRTYIEEKEKEIDEYNTSHVLNRSVLLNGRNQTNIGVFKYYMELYLKQNQDINQEMTLMVRQLEPSEKGVSLQVYAFTKTKVWAEYETVMSNIFDHLLSSVNYFELAVFENPTGRDFRAGLK